MTTSNSVDHSVSRDNIITDALMIVGAIGPEDTAPATWVTQAARMLNNVFKSWEGLGIALWARKTGYILPITATNTVLLGPSGGAATNSYVQNTLSASASSGASTITVTSSTGMLASDNIGIELTDSSMFYTTINGAPSGNTITLASTLTGAAASGNYVYTYTTKIRRPIHIIDAFRHDQTTGADVPINVIAKTDYDRLGLKTAVSLPTLLVYDPQLTNGSVFFYPQLTNGRSIITIIFMSPFEDFDASADTPDTPQQFYDALTMALAVRLAPIYGMPFRDRSALKSEAKEALDMALETEPEDGSLLIQPEMR